MSVRLFARSLPLILASAWLAGPVMAQTTAPAALAPTPAPAATQAAAAPAHASAVVEKRIQMLHTTLKITPDQTKAFDEFAQVMRDNANRMDTLLKDQTKDMAAMSAVDHMKAYEAITQARADDMQRQVPAFSRLYDTLTPEQKKLADDSFRRAAAAGPHHR